jgi:MFS family permease
MSPRFATFLMFVVNGTIVGTWIASIPAIQAKHAASGTEIGLVLLAGALGALVAMPITGQLLAHVSSRRILIGTALVFPLLAGLPLVAPTALVLAALLLAWGASNGAMDVAMNAHGIALEKAGGKPIVSSLHAGWSLGGIVGAAGVAAGVVVGVDAVVEAIAMGLFMWILAIVASRFIGSGSVATQSSARIRLPSRAILPIGLLAITVGLVEGGLSDWAGIYLRVDIGSEAAVAAFGYAAFALGMTLGRLGGDAVRERVGSVRMIQWGMLVVALTVAALLLVGNAFFAFAGLFVAGIGLANAIPQFFNAAGRVPPAGPSLSAVFTLTYAAFLIGPPVIGVASDAIGITLALGILVVASLAVAVTVTRVPSVETNPRFGSVMAGRPEAP